MRKIPHVKAGDKITVGHYNVLADAINRLQNLKVAFPMEMHAAAEGWVLRMASGATGEEARWIVFTLTESLVIAGSADAAINYWFGGNDPGPDTTVYDYMDAFFGSAGAIGLAVWDTRADRWVIVNLQCPTTVAGSSGSSVGTAACPCSTITLVVGGNLVTKAACSPNTCGQVGAHILTLLSSNTAGGRLTCTYTKPVQTICGVQMQWMVSISKDLAANTSTYTATLFGGGPTWKKYNVPGMSCTQALPCESDGIYCGCSGVSVTISG